MGRRPGSPATNGQELACGHNDWDHVRTRGGVANMRCRTCETRTTLLTTDDLYRHRCGAFRSPTGCHDGSACHLLHVHKGKQCLAERAEKFGDQVLDRVPRSQGGRAVGVRGDSKRVQQPLVVPRNRAARLATPREETYSISSPTTAIEAAPQPRTCVSPVCCSSSCEISDESVSEAFELEPGSRTTTGSGSGRRVSRRYWHTDDDLVHLFWTGNYSELSLARFAYTDDNISYESGCGWETEELLSNCLTGRSTTA
eukprot:TRINITY_DN5979_c0_g1_i7.p1 TRINITY_DN5979_c0_g1~~TRINITY_DN5979_c0_g1_i7.p1  ORF type:complete len:256 (+),score=38.95 TRINITY_DN5979_c0_g1_i7:62-829(+)